MPRISFKGSEPNKGGVWEPLPKGDYLLEIESVEETVARTGTEQLRVDSIVVDGEYAGQKVVMFMPLSDKAGFRLRGLVEAAIPDKADIVDTGEVDQNDRPICSVDFDTDDLIGARFIAQATQEPDQNGGTRNNWYSFRSEVEEGDAPADDEQPEEEEAAPPTRRNAAPAKAAAPARNAAPAKPAPTRNAAPARTATPQRTAAPARGAAPTRERRRLNG